MLIIYVVKYRVVDGSAIFFVNLMVLALNCFRVLSGFRAPRFQWVFLC
jgi:hypothetical protein